MPAIARIPLGLLPPIVVALSTLAALLLQTLYPLQLLRLGVTWRCGAWPDSRRNLEPPAPQLPPPPLVHQRRPGWHLVPPGYSLLLPTRTTLTRLVLAAPFVLGGLQLLARARQELKRHGVHPRFKPVSTLVTSGPFRFTRNPMCGQ